MIGAIVLNTIKITYDGAGKYGALEGQAFMGTMVNKKECASLVIGELAPNRMMDITAANMAAFISVLREVKEPPKRIMEMADQVMAGAFAKVLEEMQSKPSTGSEYEMEFLLEMMKVVVTKGSKR